MAIEVVGDRRTVLLPAKTAYFAKSGSRFVARLLAWPCENHIACFIFLFFAAIGYTFKVKQTSTETKMDQSIFQSNDPIHHQSARPQSFCSPIWFSLGLLLIGASIFATWDAWFDMGVTGYTDGESGHILLAPIAFAWIFFTHASELSKLRYRHQWAGPLIVGTAWLLWSYGYRHQVHTCWHLGAVLTMVGGLVTITGPEIVFRFLPAFGALVFLIPVAGERRQQIAGPMQGLTAQITQAACELLGMTVERQGSLLSYNGVPVAIAEACNGMRMVISILVLTYTYVFTTPIRSYVKVLLLLLTPVVAVVCNVSRLIPTVWVFGHKSSQTAANFHDWAGWVMLFVAFIMLMLIVQLLRWLDLPVDAKS